MDNELYNYSDRTFSPDAPIVWSSDTWKDKSIPPSCRLCSNHPINGGSGICWCVLGVPEIR